ncbi:hypothetical protein NCCP1664_20060 [Zafaria cholistanensis]|uniref:Uncharacterized protein n=1 Tax=Zafaria cholistanensis TaxID=1682741 RepID=A0A5A7NUL9_9MICC|nr:hypothetical protein NCCP1664_20060 [Zafaria cholistanensis]
MLGLSPKGSSARVEAKIRDREREDVWVASTQPGDCGPQCADSAGARFRPARQGRPGSGCRWSGSSSITLSAASGHPGGAAGGHAKVGEQAVSRVAPFGHAPARRPARFPAPGRACCPAWAARRRRPGRGLAEGTEGIHPVQGGGARR